MVATPPTVQPPSLRTRFVDASGGLMPTSLQFLQQMWLAIKNAFETLAPIDSPTFTGIPAGPTAAPGTSTTQLATTAFVAAIDLSAYAPLASPALTGNPTAPTPTPGDNDTSIATTAFVTAATAGFAPNSADYLVKTANGSLTAERVVTDVASGVTWDWATAGQAKANVGAGYTGGTSIATLGTVTTGVWNGTAIAITDGGTGASTASGARTNLGVATINIPFVIDGGGSTLTTGMKGYLGPFDFAFTITQNTLLADVSGSIVVDVFKCTYTQFDAGSTHPVSGDKITASAPPTISTATKSQDATLSGWTTAVAVGDILAFNINSVTTVKRVTIMLKATR